MSATISRDANPHGSLHTVVSRRSFEDWIGGPPYERDLYRWPMDETKHAWPGQYKDIAVQLAWEAWCEAANAAGERLPARQTVMAENNKIHEK